MAYKGLSSEKFEDLGEELDVLCSEIQSGIDKIQRLDGELKKQKIREVQKQIEDSKIILEEMEEEILIAPGEFRNKMNTTVRNKSRVLEKLKRDMNKMTNSSQTSSARDDLFSTGPKQFDPNASQRNKLLQGTDILNRTSDSVARSQQIAAESEQIGVEIIDDLDNQRESLLRTRDRLRETDEDLGKSRKILKRMALRVATNKLIMGLIIFVELVIVGAVVYIRFIK
ncbi:vesicle transport through interaction with t-SNAREs homolog 1B-like [Xenia sp. Carnegie-2017]|uniref:vesicle transport through interaction with t-SNAREs homolog 1B-like n=1 Tax=Xenia sp. Carnegie-2017 TaxID=2897299 RepID=UPI001F04F8E8|nr:vesicle transport through interaction with t-SNAREs homolog 1B-like [Xenia sp. Carnegie-2017]